MEPHNYQDTLTGISNRRFFVENLDCRRQRCVENGDNCAILFVDVENLKAVNTAYGRTVGDALLMRVAKILKQHIREADVAARIGGDEFGLLLEHLNGDQVEDKIAFLLAQLHGEHIFHASEKIPLGASIDYCCMGPQDTTDGLMSRAEFTSYRSKDRPALPPELSL
jgi:diguanylate cyclase (GGDEF)-like protein